MSDKTRPVDDREGLRKQAEEQAEREDALTRGESEGGGPTPKQTRAAKEPREERPAGTGSAMFACLRGGERLESGDRELLRWLKEAMRHRGPKARDDHPGDR